MHFVIVINFIVVSLKKKELKNRQMRLSKQGLPSGL